MTSQLAISNPRRRLLSGPQYLDDLVVSKSNTDLAVVHLDTNGTTAKLDYASLHQASWKLARCIQEHRNCSTRPNTIIPVILPQGPLLYISYLGVLRAGAAFCPVLPDTPDERLQFIIGDVQADCVLCMPRNVEHLQKLLPSTKCIAISLTDCLNQQADPSIDHEQSRLPSDIAYVMYTSGSTGKPKGVLVSHLAVTQSILAHDEHIPHFERFFQFAAPTFDVSVFEIFFPWFRGATLASCERERTLTDLPAVLRQLAVDAVELTPTVATTLLRRRDAVPSLTTLLTIGEMLTPQIIEQFGGSTKQAGILFAMYGPTEASIHCTVEPAMRTSNSIKDIGRPLSTVTAFILKESSDFREKEILHYGQSGELAIAGQLADGYLNRTAESKAAFVDLPGYGVVYCTGDRATMAPDGTIQMEGRISGGQVKLRGQRVELGEVESVALQADGVDLAVATIIQDTLILFCSGASFVRPERIEARCKSWLPRHMRPGGIIVVGDMPRLPSGKIDRKGLEQIYLNQQMVTLSEGSDSVYGNSSWIRAVIAKEIGTTIDDNQSLWASGLTSLRAITIASRLREHYLDISVSTVLEADTVSQLITVLRYQNEDSSWSEQASQTDSENSSSAETSNSIQGAPNTIGGEEDVRIVPCSKMQNAMLAETSRNPSLNFNKIVLRARVPVSLSQLLEALKKLARKNPVLRAKFESTGNLDNPFVQIIGAEPSFEHAPTMQHPMSVRLSEDDREFIIIIHHALYDGWSWDLIMKDINILLNGGSIRTRPSFEKFARLTRQKYETHVQEDLTAWTSVLQHVNFHKFPTLCSAPPAQPGRSSYSNSLSTSAEKLSIFAVGMRINMATTIHAALALLLAQYLDTNQVVTGMVLAGREPVMPEVEEVIGPCLLSLPLLTRLSDCQTIRDLLVLTYQQYMHSLRHSSVSLAEIANALSLLTEVRLFDVLFVWQESFYPSGQGHDKIYTTATDDHLDYALVIEAEANESSVHLKTTFDTTRMSLDQVECMHSQINALVHHFVQSPDMLIDRAWNRVPESLLSWFQPPTCFNAPDDLTLMLSRTATNTPHQVALDFVTEYNPTSKKITRATMTYEELYERASQVASRLLISHKLAKDDIVALCCTKSPSLYVMIYAVILAGAAYLCVDPNTPERRIHEIFQQANPKLVFMDSSDDRLMRISCDWLTLSIGGVMRYEAGVKCQLEVQRSGSDLAYAVLTSGSTGVPKGVLITRDNLASNLQHLSSIYPFDASSRLMQSCSLAFDVSVFEIFWTWSCGSTLCSAINDIIFQDIEGFIDTMNITHLSMTPSVAALVDPNNVTKVRFLVCAGEPMSAKVYKLWANRGLYQGYGPSETTNICNVRAYPDGPKLINNVGPAFPNTSLFICSRRARDRRNQALSVIDFEILPRGAIGEIWIGGQQVGRGYTDSELTQQSFFKHPQYGRLYKSGDFGRLLPDNSLMVTGREDDQTKIRGQRIELNEINSRLMQSVYVSDTATMILSAEDSRQKLVAFWVCENRDISDYGFHINLVYDHLYETLPSYMVPECLIPLPKLPLTPQGKVDKRAMLASYRAMSQGELAACSSNHITSHKQQASSPAEITIGCILAEMINVSTSEINVYGSFFSYGIDSIRAIAFARRIKEAGFTSVQVSDILKHPSINRLASLLQGSSSAESVTESDFAATALSLDIRQNVTDRLVERGLDVAQVLPCTPLQIAMVMAHESFSNDSYSNHIVYRLEIDAARVKRAWITMIDKHHLLRTMFAQTEDADYPCVQVVLESFQLPWHILDDEEPLFAGSPFKQPPYSLYLKSRASYVELHLFMHHALYDAEALVHLQTDIQSLCLRDKLTARPAFSTFLDFMLNVNQERSKQFWNHTLKDVVPCHLLQSGAQARNRSRSIVRHVQYSESWTKLTSRARRISVTPLALFQAALARLLIGYTHSADICFGTVFSGRNVNVTDVDKIIGPCFNTLPSRVYLRQSSTSADLCQSFHSFNVSALPYQAASLRELQGQYSPHGAALFDTLLLLQSAAPKLDPRIWTLVHEEGQMAFPFIFEVQQDEENDRLNFYLHSNATANTDFLDEVLKNFTDLVTDTAEHLDKLALNRTPSYHSSESVDQAMHGHSLINGSAQRMKDTTIEQQVMQALHTVSKRNLSDIIPATTIFHLGLDSISTVQLAAKLRKLGFQVSAGDILDEPRIHQIVQLCECRRKPQLPELKGYDIADFDHKHRNIVARKLSIAEDELTAVWPCTVTQIGILSEYSKSNGRCYNNSVRVRLAPQTDIICLHDALEQTVELHAMLRTGFMEIDDTDAPYAMIVYPKITPDIRYLNEATMNRELPTPTLQDLSQPPWYLELYEDKQVMYVELHILHALYDAYSLRLILRDLGAIYHKTPISKPPPVDKALSLIVASNRAEYEVEDALPFSLSDVQVTKFPNLNVLRDVPTNFSVAELKLRAQLGVVQNRCEDLGCSLSTVVQATWAQLLGAYTGQSSVVFGNIYSGRAFEIEELNEVAFPCINTLPIFVDLMDGQIPIIEQVAKINAYWQKNPHQSLVKIKRSLAVEGILFDTIVVLQDQSLTESNTIWDIESEEATAEYAISLEIITTDGQIKLLLTYNHAILPPEHGSILLEQYENALYGIIHLANNALQTSGALLSLRPPTCKLILSDDACLHDLVLASAARHPYKVAIEFITNVSGSMVQKQTWTYRETVMQANRVANLLVEHGSRAGDMIALCCEKSPWASFALLGILMAGCTYVAIDPSAPASRKDFILEDSHCKIVLVNCSIASTFATREDTIILRVDDDQIMSQQSSCFDSKHRRVTPQDVCYCLYTSGTTGTPKGCLITHQSAAQAMMSFSKIFEGHWTDDSRWLQFAAYHFDVSVLEHFWSWKEGICVTVVPRDLLFEDLPGTIAKVGVTHLDLTPSLARLLTPESVPSLCQGVFIVGGEEVRQEIIDTWGGAGCLYNFYGPSEVTIGCTVHPRVQKGVKATNIGRQWDNVGTLVLEPNTQQPVPIGAVGELCLSGVLVGKGYLNRPELTSEKFTILNTTGERIYRSGDLVRMLHDYSFEFLGRIDDQVKLRGQRLEIGEINHAILECSSEFQDAAALVVEHPQQERQHLIAFLARKKDGKGTEVESKIIQETNDLKSVSGVRSQVLNRLPGYMVPTYFVVLNFLPLTVNNKVDTKALRSMYRQTSISNIREQQQSSSTLANEGSEAYSKFIGIIADFLGVSKASIGPHDSLLQLGLDSITVIGLVRAMKKVGYANASVIMVLQRPVVADLAAVLCVASNAENDRSKVDQGECLKQMAIFANRHRAAVEEILHSKIENIAPCTALQEGMISKLLADHSEWPPYMTNFIFKLDPTIDFARLQSAWRALQAHLDILRVRFIPTDDGFAQVMLYPSEEPTLTVGSCTDCTQTDALAKIQEHFKIWVKSVRSLGPVSPWQARITQLDSGSLYMTVFMFHGLYDGISMENMLTYLHHLYKNPQARHAAPQFFEALPYGPLLRKVDASSFWQQNLQRVHLLDSSTSSQLVREPNFPKTIHRELLAPNIRRVCSSLAVTSQAIFHAAWLLTLAQHFDQNPTIGIVLSGRSVELEHADKIIGPMFNTLPFHVDCLPHDARVSDLIQACHRKNIDTLPYHHTPLSSIRKFLRLPPNRELFDSLFVYQISARSAEDSQRPWVELQAESQAEYPLNVEIEESEGNRYNVRIVASANFVGDSELKTLIESFTVKLTNLPDTSNQSLSDCFFGKEMVSGQSRSTFTEANSTTLMKNWTTDAENVRATLAELACTDITNIGHDSPTIFELGLDSIDALKLVARLKSQKFRTSVSKVLQNPTVAGILAQHDLEQALDSSSETVDLPFHDMQNLWRETLWQQGLSSDHVSMIMPTTPLQQGLLVEFDKYFHTMVFKITSNVNIHRLISAVQECVRAMAVLRTSFTTIEGTVGIKSTFMQIVTESSIAVEKSELLNHLRDANDLARLASELWENSNIVRSTPKLKIACLENGKNYLLLALSHASYDAWSLRLILHHLEMVYTGSQSLTDDTQLTAQYVHTLHREHESSKAEEFWSTQLMDAKPTFVTIDQSNARHPAILRQRLDRIPLDRIHTACRRHGVTLQSLGLAVWTLLLIRLTRQTDTNYGVVVSGRVDETTERLIFPTFNTVIFRARVDEKMTKYQLLRMIHDQAIELFEHQQYPLSTALSKVQKHGGDLFNTLFTFQRSPTVETGGPLLFEEIDLGDREISPPYPINVELQETDIGLEWTIATQGGVMSIEGIDNILDSLNKILGFLITPEDENIFQVNDGSISICGLPPIVLEEEAEALFSAGNHRHSQSGSAKDGPTKAESSTVENQIRHVFSMVSGIDVAEIGKDTSVYHLGLDSVSAIKVSRLLKDLGTRVPVSVILRHQSVARIALATREIGESIVSRSDNKKESSKERRDIQKSFKTLLHAAGVAESNVEEILPTTGGQVYMLDMWRASRGRLFYATFSFEVKNCDRLTFDAAFIKLVREVPALRTQFMTNGDKTYQVVFRASSGVHGPVQYEVTEQGSSLIVALHIHHALYDAISLDLMVQQLKRLCSADVVWAKNDKKLCSDQRTFLHALQLDAAEGQRFWSDYLSGAGSKTKPANSFNSPRTELFVPELIHTKSLETLARREGISLQAIFFATMARLHGRRQATSGGVQPDVVVIGVYLANRSLDVESVSDLAVPTFNIVPLKVNIHSLVSVVEAAKKVQADLQEITRAEHCGISLRDIHSWIDLTVDCYINFLRLPDTKANTVRTKQQGEVEVEIEHADGELRERAKALLHADKVVSPFVQETMVEGSGTEWCSPALDVEAKIDEDGNLAVGMFVPRDMIDDIGVRSLMEELRLMLEGMDTV